MTLEVLYWEQIPKLITRKRKLSIGLNSLSLFLGISQTNSFIDGYQPDSRKQVFSSTNMLNIWQFAIFVPFAKHGLFSILASLWPSGAIWCHGTW